MKGTVVVYTGVEKVELSEYDVADPEPGCILAEVVQANVCGSELHIWTGGHPSVRPGQVLGHEMVLRVAKLGEGVTTDFAGQPLREGDRIVCTYFQICRRCPSCQAGQFNLCQDTYRYWSQPAATPPHFHGAFATHYYVHPDQYVYRVPESIPNTVAASANCALSEMLFGVERAGVKAGETLVIQGAGGLGLYGTAVAKVRGARVIVVDGVPLRLEQARQFGADEVVDFREYPTFAERQARIQSLTGGLGPDAVIDVTGVPSSFEDGWQLLRPGGRLVEIGTISPGRKTEVDVGLMTRRGVQIIACLRYQPWYLRLALEFLVAHQDRFPFDALVDAVYPLEEAVQALRDSAARKVTRASLAVEGR